MADWRNELAWDAERMWCSTHNAHLEDEVLVVWIAVEKVTGNADDDHGADPRHGIAAGDGEAESLGGNNEDHIEAGIESRLAWLSC
jgi:hypothetical protein